MTEPYSPAPSDDTQTAMHTNVRLHRYLIVMGDKLNLRRHDIDQTSSNQIVLKAPSQGNAGPPIVTDSPPESSREAMMHVDDTAIDTNDQEMNKPDEYIIFGRHIDPGELGKLDEDDYEGLYLENLKATEGEISLPDTTDTLCKTVFNLYGDIATDRNKGLTLHMTKPAEDPSRLSGVVLADGSIVYPTRINTLSNLCAVNDQGTNIPGTLELFTPLLVDARDRSIVALQSVDKVDVLAAKGSWSYGNARPLTFQCVPELDDTSVITGGFLSEILVQSLTGRQVSEVVLHDPQMDLLAISIDDFHTPFEVKPTIAEIEQLVIDDRSSEAIGSEIENTLRYTTDAGTIQSQLQGMRIVWCHPGEDEAGSFVRIVDGPEAAWDGEAGKAESTSPRGVPEVFHR